MLTESRPQVPVASLSRLILNLRFLSVSYREADSLSTLPEVPMWRQGDVFIAPVTAVPASVRRLAHGVLVEGEATGHSHRVEDLGTAEVFQGRDELYLRVRSDSARIVHQEHGPITLPRGTYRVWKQREYAPGAFRWVTD